jgi:outer membrane receptor protein involved in Fe transport
VSTALTWQHLSEITEEISKQRVPSADYFDLTASYEPTEKLRLHGGVSNLLEKEPPTIRNQWTNTDPNTYDALGRYFFVGATVRY